MPQTIDPDQTRSSEALLPFIIGPWLSQALFVAAKLGVADLLRYAPQSCAALADVTKTDEQSLYRILRALASVGIFAEDENRRFRMTPMAEPLQTGVPGSLRSYAIMIGEEWHWQPWGEILQSVKTGRPAFEHVFGASLSDYLARHPNAGRILAEALDGKSDIENDSIVSAYDFASFRTIVDVGGGKGTCLTSILTANPEAKGILFDLPHVIDTARPAIEASGLASRCTLMAGNFFESVPSGGDVYILKKIVQNWDDDRARLIQGCCRTAIPNNGRLLTIEFVIPPGNEPSFGKLLDLLLLIWTGGKERTEAEHQDLLSTTGFKPNQIIPTASALTIIESLPI